MPRAATHPEAGVTLGVRPEDITLEPTGESAATVELVENTGPAQIAVFSWGGERWHALVAKGAALRVGDTVFPRLDLARAALWPSSPGR